MSNKTKTVACPQCGHEISGSAKVSFFSGHREYLCEHCHYKGGLPLNTSRKILYFTITVIVLWVALNLATGGQGFIGLIGLIVPWLLFKDWQTNKKLKAYREKNGLEANNFQPKEKYGVIIGIIYSIIAIIITWALGTYIYGNSSTISQNTSATPANTATSTTNSWQVFNSIDGGFKASFPTVPKKEDSPTSQTNGVTIQSTTYSSNEGAGSSYMVGVFNYNIKPAQYNVKNGLEGMINGAVNNTKGATLTSSSFTTFGKYQAADFVINVPSEKSTIQGKAIIRNDLPTIKAYMILVAYTGTSSQFNQFVNSFAFTN